MAYAITWSSALVQPTPPPKQGEEGDVSMSRTSWLIAIVTLLAIVAIAVAPMVFPKPQPIAVTAAAQPAIPATPDFKPRTTVQAETHHDKIDEMLMAVPVGDSGKPTMTKSDFAAMKTEPPPNPNGKRVELGSFKLHPDHATLDFRGKKLAGVEARSTSHFLEIEIAGEKWGNGGSGRPVVVAFNPPKKIDTIAIVSGEPHPIPGTTNLAATVTLAEWVP